jgi:hypothetical protein
MRTLRGHPLAKRSGAVLIALGCGGACGGLGELGDDTTRVGVGAPCTVADEDIPSFSGFSEREVNIEQGGSCGSSNVCLVHDFRGRATCPSGQTDAEIGACVTPSGEPVVVPVEPQLVGRSADVGMICSCRCDGPDPSASYCTCPSGMRCEELISSRSSGAFDELAGSYCVY